MEAFIANHSDLIRRTIEEIGSFAQESVASGHGGPLAAQLALFSLNRAGQCSPEILFPPSGNMVLETGIASFHAEAHALSSGQISILKHKIRELAFTNN